MLFRVNSYHGSIVLGVNFHLMIAIQQNRLLNKIAFSLLLFGQLVVSGGVVSSSSCTPPVLDFPMAWIYNDMSPSSPLRAWGA